MQSIKTRIMKKNIRTFITFSFLAVSILSGGQLYAQNTMPEVMEKGSLEEQKDYLTEKTNIYNGYRAVRDDVFLKMLKNSLDSLNSAKKDIQDLTLQENELNSSIASLNKELGKVKSERDTAIKNRNNMTLFGISLNKTSYNLILWGIIAGLIFLLAIVFMLYKRSYIVTANTRKDLEDTREEFEAFRKSSREKQEQLVLSHFNEIKKLKGGA